MEERISGRGCRILGETFSAPQPGQSAARGLSVSTPVAQQRAIAAADESQSALNQADGAIAEIVGFPGALGNSTFPKQGLSDRAVAVSFLSAVECAQRKRQPLPSLCRQWIDRSCGRLFAEGSPKAMSRLAAKMEISIEWELDRNGR